MTQIHACCPGHSSRALQRCPRHCCNSRLTNRRVRNRCRVHTAWQIELIVFIHYIRILSNVTMPTCDVLLRHFRKMLLRVRIRSCTLSSLIYSWRQGQSPGRSGQSKLSAEAVRIINEQMEESDVQVWNQCFFSHSPEVADRVKLDFERNELLPDDSGCK